MCTTGGARLMTTVTLLIDPEEFRAGRAEIRGDKYKHLFKVRRLATRSRIRIVDGEGNARWGTVGRIDSKTAEFLRGDRTLFVPVKTGK